MTAEKHAELWRASAWERGPGVPAELQGETHHARLSPDGTTLVIKKDGKITLLNIATGQILAVCEGGSPAGICVNEEFSPDGQRLTLLWQYGAAHAWDLAMMHRELASTRPDWKAAP